MRSTVAPMGVLALCLAAPAGAAPASRAARMDAYLSIWADDAAVTPGAVGRLYGRQVEYYGRSLSAAGVYRDKLAFIRRWPLRSYAAVPGTVTNDCTASSPSCRVSAVMRWSRSDRAGHGESGTSTVRLDLAREGGTLRILRESGGPVAR